MFKPQAAERVGIGKAEEGRPASSDMGKDGEPSGKILICLNV